MKSVRSQPRARCSRAAMHQRSCGTVSAGVHFFSPPGFLRQEPGGDEGQSLMMVPASPGSHLVVRQARLSFGTLEAVLDAMLRLEDAGEFGQRGVPSRVRQTVVMLERAVRLPLAEHDQDF